MTENHKVKFLETNLVEGKEQHWFDIDGSEYGLNEDGNLVDANGVAVEDESIVEAAKKHKKEQLDSDDDKDKDDGDKEEDEDNEDEDEKVSEKKMKKRVTKDESYREDEQPEKEVKGEPHKLSKKNKEKMKESLNKILDESELDLSEEFKEKLSAVFEVSVKEARDIEVERIEEEAQEEIKNRMEAYEKELSEQTSEYLNYVAEKFVNDNMLAIESGVKMEIYENFFNGMKNVFESANVEVPANSDSIVERVEKANEKLSEELETSIKENVELKQRLDEVEAEKVFEQVSEGLTDVEKERFAKLVEDFEFTGKERYKSKLSTIRESYFTEDTHNSDKPEDGGKEINEEKEETFQSVARKRYDTNDSDVSKRTVEFLDKWRA